MLGRVARWSFRKWKAVVALWLVALFGSIAAGQALGGDFIANPVAPDSESTSGFNLLAEHFGGRTSDFPGSVVFKAEQGVDDPAVEQAMTALFEAMNVEDDVTVISPYSPFGAQQVSQNPVNDAAGKIAFATVNFAPGTDQIRGSEVLGIDRVADARAAADAIDGLQVEFGGEIFAEFEPPESELLGLAFAIIVLIAAFGSVLAMGLPIVVALGGVGTGAGLILILTRFLDTPDFATVLGAMIGLGVGIDYALFIVTRYREELHAGVPNEDAAVIAFSTAGRSVVFAGITVVISLLGMLVIGLPFISALGIATALTVMVTMLASLTLLPALLGIAGDRIEVTRRRGLIAAGFASVALFAVGLHVPQLAAVAGVLMVATLLLGLVLTPLKKEIPRRAAKPLNETVWYRWSRVVQRHPWAGALLGGGLLILLTIPLFSLRLGFSDTGNYPEETTTRKAYDLTVEGFGAGFNAPILLATEVTSPAQFTTINTLVQAVSSDPGVVAVNGPLPSDVANPQASAAALIQIIPTTGPQDEVTEQLVERLRSDIVPAVTGASGLDVFVTGQVPAQMDFTDYLSGRMILFFVAVLALSFLLLTAVFRSVLVPLKAVIMNLLSIGSAYGLLVALFQWGWGAEIFGLAGGAPIEPFLPFMLFAIVFGLSMDYEVFLISRIREDFDRTGDARESVANGLASTARVISAAAAIMVVVFGSFLLEDNRIVKMFGFGLGSAVLLDATLVRMLLVPSTMELLGERNWWIPKWLDRILPTIDVEGHDYERPSTATVPAADPPGTVPATSPLPAPIDMPTDDRDLAQL